ncbi:hypothetical protein [Marinifilum fragile]|uniref:phosphoribosyltransferase-like protein n=1 Tax=Marinifilum fragile TaxID=570161 RepID=UPI002AAC3CC0|nr:hypothetical protein [Marinifilum fragile]
MRKAVDDPLSLEDKLLNKIMTYYSSIWRDRREDKIHEKWLDNFPRPNDESEPDERLNALFLLSKFMYFGNLEMRELLKCVFRDLFKYNIISNIRKANGDILDLDFLHDSFRKELVETRFLGVGNPSESGVHLLYYFRQENALTKKLFLNAYEIFRRDIIVEKDIHDYETRRLDFALSDPKIRRYVFIDDFCGSGSQATIYSREIVDKIKELDPEIEVHYLMLFGTEIGVDHIKRNTSFDNVQAVFTLDDSFKCFSKNSRFFQRPQEGINKELCEEICYKYGSVIEPSMPMGYRDGQLLLGLFHNTPDNTLPIIWSDSPSWTPIFKRYHKIY